MTNLLHKEYIYDGSLNDADSNIDKGHEAHIIENICHSYADDLVQIAEELLETKFYDDENMGDDEKETKEELESYIEKINDYISQGEFDPYDVYSFYNFIKKVDPSLVSNPKLQDAMEAIHGDARLYGCKNLGYIIIRGNNFEVWQLDQGTTKKIVHAVYDIFDQENIVDRENMLNQEINVHSYNNGASRTYTLEELEKGELLKISSIPKTKANFYIPPLKQKQSYSTKRPAGLSQSQYQGVVSTSESLSFKKWLLGL